VFSGVSPGEGAETSMVSTGAAKGSRASEHCEACASACSVTTRALGEGDAVGVAGAVDAAEAEGEPSLAVETEAGAGAPMGACCGGGEAGGIVAGDSDSDSDKSGDG